MLYDILVDMPESISQRHTAIYLPQLCAVLLLLWALNPSNPYGYYILLRWICCGVFSYLAVKASKYNQEEWAWVFGVIAAIYNPIFRVPFGREVWTVVNLATIVAAVISMFRFSKKLSA